MIKDKNKEVYTSPQTEVLVVNTEGMVCGSPWDSNNNTEGMGDDGDIIHL